MIREELPWNRNASSISSSAGLIIWRNGTVWMFQLYKDEWDHRKRSLYVGIHAISCLTYITKSTSMRRYRSDTPKIDGVRILIDEVEFLIEFSILGMILGLAR